MSVYISELYWLARDCVETCDAIFAAAHPPPSRDKSYIKVDHDLQAQLYRVLNNAARIRALVSERPRRRDQSAKQYGVQQARMEWLRTCLGDVQLKEVLHARVRNSLEHFDEYLDGTALKFSRQTISGNVLLPMDMTLGRESTLDQFTLEGSVYPLRVYLAEERIFVNCGKRVAIGTIAGECDALVKHLDSTFTIAHEEETTAMHRGSPMLVLTDRTFDKEQPSS